MKRTVERINWDLADPEQFEYHRAAYGMHPPLPPYECEVVNGYGLPGWRAVERAADAIIAVKNIVIYDRPKDFQTCDQVIVAFLNASDAGQGRSARHDYGTKVWHSFLSLALALAKRDTMYWRIADPAKESYCSYCRRARPVSEFSRHEAACDRHKLSRYSRPGAPRHANHYVKGRK